jgi:hypothetical protein
MMVLTAHSLERLGARIRRAYVRSSCGSLPDEVFDSRLWQAIAARLLEFHRADRSIPLDPELFVRSQGLRNSDGSSPHLGLLEARAWRVYRACVRRIVRGLSRELRGEVARLRRQVRDGHPIETVLSLEGRRVTALGSYVFAMMEGRPDLAESLRPACARQHEACPLYQLAFTRLLPDVRYPAPSVWDLQFAAENFSRSLSSPNLN